MSKRDTKRLGNVIGNVFHEVVSSMAVATDNDNIWAMIRTAQINATATIVAALIKNENEIYHDH